MTEKDRAIQVIQMLPEDATLRDILNTLEHLGEAPDRPSRRGPTNVCPKVACGT